MLKKLAISLFHCRDSLQSTHTETVDKVDRSPCWKWHIGLNKEQSLFCLFAVPEQCHVDKTYVLEPCFKSCHIAFDIEHWDYGSQLLTKNHNFSFFNCLITVTVKLYVSVNPWSQWWDLSCSMYADITIGRTGDWPTGDSNLISIIGVQKLLFMSGETNELFTRTCWPWLMKEYGPPLSPVHGPFSLPRAHNIMPSWSSVRL